MIPKIDSFAAYNSYSSFTYTYSGYPYWFNASISSSSIEYTFDSSVLDYVIENGADALKVSLANNIFGIKITEFAENIVNFIYSAFFNARVALGKVYADWFVGSDISACYAWQIQLLDIDENYPGHETYGPAYGWRFEGIFGEDTDLVLDQYGNFYGSNVIGNYTFVDVDDELDWISIHQLDSEDDLFWVPPSIPSFNELKQPYFEGTTLNFFYYDGSNTLHSFQVTNFVECFIGLKLAYNSSEGPVCWLHIYSKSSDFSNHTYIQDGSVVTSGNTTGNIVINLNGVNTQFKGAGFPITITNINLPSYNVGNTWNSAWNVYTAKQRGIYQSSFVIQDVPNLWLEGLSYTPVSDPVEVPTDVPIPIGDIPSDPTDFDPEPSQDPDPVPGADYPEPEPQPTPVPPIPPIVSGNDDLWPDVNDLIAAEDSLGEYTFAIRNFEWPDFSNLMGDYLSPLIWVSTIISTLFNSSAYSIIFSVLSLMFVVAALLGILKGWTSRDG